MIWKGINFGLKLWVNLSAVSCHRKGERLISVPIEHSIWADCKISILKQKPSQKIQDSVVDMGVHLMVIMMKTVIYFPPVIP